MSGPKTKVYSPGSYLFREGESSRSLFLIQKGSVGIRKAKGSAFVELARLYSNEVVGELSFFDRLPRSASAIALTEVESLEITFESLDKIYENVPPYLKTIMASVADRLRKADDQIRRLQKDTIQEDASVQANVDEEGQSATDVLAATADINIDEIAEGEEGDGKKG
jgi:CRP/FNR family cyclic AMP-dependent transcriptional regulator